MKKQIVFPLEENAEYLLLPLYNLKAKTKHIYMKIKEIYKKSLKKSSLFFCNKKRV